MDLIDFNTAHRRVDVEDDIIPIANIARQTFNYTLTTIISPVWQEYKPVTQDEYTARFIENNIYAQVLLDAVRNIVIAGGTAVKPLHVDQDSKIYSDYDIFIYGISDEQLFWNKVNEITSVLNDLLQADFVITHKIKKGIVVLGVYDTNVNSIIMEFQIILRMYITLSSIIHSFDIPCCCVAYDGKTAYTTTLGAFAHATQINLAGVDYRSPTYEKRLLKYYDRGYGIAFINYNLDNGYDASRKRLLHKHFEINVIINCPTVNRFVCTVRLTDIRYDHFEDYSDIKPTHVTYLKFTNHAQSIEHLGLILESKSNKMVNYGQLHKMNLRNIFAAFPYTIKTIINKQISKLKKIPVQRIKQYTCLPSNVIKEIIILLIDIDTNKENETAIYNILYEQILFYANYIPDWLIKFETDALLTSSFYPIISTEEEWYGFN